MTPFISELLETLQRFPQMRVGESRLHKGIFSAWIYRGDQAAMLVASPDLPPVRLSPSGKKQYGAYTIHRDRPDWIKGDDPAQCSCYLVGWFDALASISGAEPFTADLGRLTPGLDLVPDIRAIMQEVARRSALRVDGEDSLAWPGTRGRFQLRLAGATVLISSEAGEYRIEGGTAGMVASAALGFMDGTSSQCDD